MNPHGRYISVQFKKAPSPAFLSLSNSKRQGVDKSLRVRVVTISPKRLAPLSYSTVGGVRSKQPLVTSWTIARDEESAKRRTN